MKTKLVAFIFLIAGILVSVQANAEKEKRDVSSFTEIGLSIPGKLHLKQGNNQSVEIEAKSSTLEKIETIVKGNKLIIRFENERLLWRSFNPGEIEIQITMPEIEGLTISGSGDILADDGINSRSLTMAVSGSGDINLEDLNAEKVSATISGSGNILINDGGGADDLSVSISGSGGVNVSGFEAKNVSVKISGSGNSKVLATDHLNVSVAGSGDVYYKGNPKINSSVAGSGSVKSMN